MNSPAESSQFIYDNQFSAISFPFISRARFAELSGIPEGVVQGWIVRGYLPIYEIGKYRLINLTLLNHLAMSKVPSL